MNHRQRSLQRQAAEVERIPITRRYLPGKEPPSKTTAAQRDDIDRATGNASNQRPNNVVRGSQ
jgi:hypothetical protein